MTPAEVRLYQRAYNRGVRHGIGNAASVVKGFDARIDHPWRLSDCILAKFNLLKKKWIGRNPRMPEHNPDEFVSMYRHSDGHSLFVHKKLPLVRIDMNECITHMGHNIVCPKCIGPLVKIIMKAEKFIDKWGSKK